MLEINGHANIDVSSVSFELSKLKPFLLSVISVRQHVVRIFIISKLGAQTKFPAPGLVFRS